MGFRIKFLTVLLSNSMSLSKLFQFFEPVYLFVKWGYLSAFEGIGEEQMR